MKPYYTLWKARGDKEFASVGLTKEVLNAQAGGHEWTKVSTKNATKITKLTHKPYEKWNQRRRSEDEDEAFAEMVLNDGLFYNFHLFNKIQVKAGVDARSSSARPSQQQRQAKQDAYMSTVSMRRG